MTEQLKNPTENNIMADENKFTQSNLPFQFYILEGEFVAKNQINNLAYKFVDNQWHLFNFPIELEREFSKPITIADLNAANNQAIAILKGDIASPENLQKIEIKNDLFLLLYPDYLEREFIKNTNRFSKVEQHLILDTLDYVKAKHQGQYREENTPYTTHLQHASIYSMRNDGTAQDAIVMLLHDVLEDTETTTEELKSKYGKVVTDSVIALSKKRNGVKVTLEEYHHGLSSNPQLLKYKGYDRLSNIVSLYLAPEWPKKANYINDTKNELIPMIEKGSTELATQLKRAVQFIEENSNPTNSEKQRIQELAQIRNLTKSITLK